MHNIIFSNHPQGSKEWLNDRIGMLSGSVCHCIFTEPTKKDKEAGIEFSDGAMTLAREIVAERLTQRSINGTLYYNEEDGFYRKQIETGAMIWGKYHENYSRLLINKKHNLNFQEVGFAMVEGIYAGCSLDGFHFEGNKRIGLEMKHYETKNVLDYIDNPNSLWINEKGKLTKEANQCIFNSWVMNLDEIYLVCRDPRLPSPLDEYFVEIHKSGEELKGLVEKCKELSLSFLEMVDNLYSKYENLSLNILGLD